jgi:hypothetical protein
MMPGEMKIEDIPTSELRRITLATERAVGADAPQVRAMRQELERREQTPPIQLSRQTGGDDEK